MKRIAKILGIIVFITIIVFLTATCNTDVNDDTVSVTGVTINHSNLDFIVNGTGTLIATIQPQNASNKTVTWSSSNTDVATVENGIVTAKGQGVAKITVKTTDGGKTEECIVSVLDLNLWTVVSSTTFGDKTGDPSVRRIIYGDNPYKIA